MYMSSNSNSNSNNISNNAVLNALRPLGVSRLSVKKLDLRNHRGQLPREISKLPNLTEINLSNSLLNRVPEEIFRCKNLKILNFFFVKLVSSSKNPTNNFV